jgi:hypothetical protein
MTTAIILSTCGFLAGYGTAAAFSHVKRQWLYIHSNRARAAKA